MRRPSPAVAVSCHALVAALGGVAIASPVGGDGKVHLCYSQAALDGAPSGENPLQVVNADDECPGTYPDRLVLNQAGPQGAAGAPGKAGPAGGVKPLDPQKIQDVFDTLAGINRTADEQKQKILNERKRISKLQKAFGGSKARKLAKTQKRVTNQMNVLYNVMKRLQQTQLDIVQAIGS